MSTFKITFIDPKDRDDFMSFTGEAASMEMAIKMGRDQMFSLAPLRAATWILRTAEQIIE